jgi:hypothetical protein
MNKATWTIVAGLAAAAFAAAGHAPTVQFSDSLNSLRDQVLKASGIQYTMPVNSWGNYFPAPNRPIRDVLSGQTVAIPTRKPNHQYQVNALDGATGAAGGWVGFDANVPEGFVYTPSRGTTYIAPLPGHVRTTVSGVSSDGNAAFGRSFSGNDGANFYWTRSGQMIDIGTAAGNDFYQQFVPKQIRPDGVVEGVFKKYGGSQPDLAATWSPSEGLKTGEPYDYATKHGVSSAAGVLTSRYDSLYQKGTVTLTETNGGTSALLNFGDGQSAEPKWLSGDGNLAIVNIDRDSGWNLYDPEVLMLDTDATLTGEFQFGANRTLADFLIEMGLDPSELDGRFLYDVSAVSTDGSLIFGGAGYKDGFDSYTETYFLIDLNPSGSPPVPEPASWLAFAMVAGIAGWRHRCDRRKSAIERGTSP